MSNTDNFLQITGCGNRELARRFLNQSGGRLDLAIDNYYNQQSRNHNSNNSNNSNGSDYQPLTKVSTQAIEQLNQIFDKYTEQSDNNKMDIDGTILYFNDLNIDAENDVKAIITAYILESPSTGVFYRKSFVKNWSKLNVFSLQDMHRYLQKAISNNQLMNQVNKFAFKYALEEGERKLPIEDAVALWRIIYKDELSKEKEVPTTASKFINEFIAGGHSGRTTINMDEWNMSRPFFQIPLEELSQLDESAAWPVLMDEFVDFHLERE